MVFQWIFSEWIPYLYSLNLYGISISRVNWGNDIPGIALETDLYSILLKVDIPKVDVGMCLFLYLFQEEIPRIAQPQAKKS